MRLLQALGLIVASSKLIAHDGTLLVFIDDMTYLDTWRTRETTV